jgi:LysM repeat protein
VSILYAKIESWLGRVVAVTVMAGTLLLGTAVEAAGQDSWIWRLETERLTQEALTAKAQTQGLLYQVKKGDTLWGLARDLNVDLDVLAAMNYLSSGDIIYAGQYLRLPVEQDKSYQVRPGDTLWHIAQQYEVDVTTLMAVNRITRPEALQVGRILTIPGSPWSMAVQGHPAVNVSRYKGARLNWPLKGRITSPYGLRDRGFHHGLDIGAKAGTPIKAAQAGTVRFAGYKNQFYGNAVEIVHDNGLITVYGHTSKNLVKEGQRVTAGQSIALVGSTGRSTGPHLHFEVRIDDRAVDPMPYLK